MHEVGERIVALDHLSTRSESRFSVARMNLALHLLQKLGR